MLLWEEQDVAAEVCAAVAAEWAEALAEAGVSAGWEAVAQDVQGADLAELGVRL